MSIHRLVILQTMYGQKKFSTFSYKLVQISPIMILVNSGAFLSISSWFSELTELIFVMIPYISSTGYPPTTQGIMGHVQVANCNLVISFNLFSFEDGKPRRREKKNYATYIRWDFFINKILKNSSMPIGLEHVN